MVGFWLCSATSFLEKIMRQITPGVDGMKDLLGDTVIMGYGNADQDRKRKQVLRNLYKRDTPLN